MAKVESVKTRKEPIPKMAVRAENIPDLLKNNAKWLLWKWVWTGSSWDKPPKKYDGANGSSTDPKTWCDFRMAMLAEPDFSGVGYAINENDGLIGIDLDYCRDPDTGKISDFALQIIEELDTYAELSPSGTGVKLWLEGKLPEPDNWMRKNATHHLEMYIGGRYFTVTGHSIHAEPKQIAKAGEQLERFLINYMRRDNDEHTFVKERPRDLDHTIDMAKDAIKHLDPNCGYDEWIDVGMALNWLSRDLFDVWDEWSKQGSDYDPDLMTHWKSFSGDQSRITIGTLFYRAEKAGWVRPVKGYEPSDYGVAQRVNDAAMDRLYYIPQWGKWYAWNGRQFAEDHNNAVAEAVVRVSRKMKAELPASTGDPKKDEASQKAHQAWCMKYQSARGIGDVTKLARGLMTLDYRELDKNPLLFHCENCVINLETLVPEPHSHERLNTTLSGVVYDKYAECPRWEEFIEQITMGDEGLAKYLQAIFGYSLSGLVDYQAVFLLFGSGQNGKGVFTRMLLKVLGGYGGPVSQDLLMAAPNQHPTQFAYLYNKRCVIAQETDQDCRLNENQMKSLTGGDNIQCRRMREDFWEFAPTHKIFLATNHKPDVRGTDNGIWRRLKCIPFLGEFKGDKHDPHLDQKLAAETSGILNWALRGWHEGYWKNGKKIDEPEIVTKAGLDYRSEMNVIEQFVKDQCLMAKEHSIATSKLYQAMKLYCEEHGLYVPKNRKFNADLHAMGVGEGRTKHARLKTGITLRSEFEDAGGEAAPVQF